MRTLLTILLISASLAANAADETKPSIARTGDWRAAVKQFAVDNLQHPAWGLSHSLRDYELAKSLAAEDKVTLDDDVLYAAAYLHDVAAFPTFRKEGVDHQDEAARIVGSLLDGTGFPMTKIEAVRGAIRTHMFARDPVGPEAIYLHDADALDWLSRIGVENVGRYEHDLLVHATERLGTVPGLTMIGTAPHKAGVLSFILAGQKTEEVGGLLDREGIAVRSGHHCAQPILRRFGVEATVRASLAPYNTFEDIDALVAALCRLQAGRVGLS